MKIKNKIKKSLCMILVMAMGLSIIGCGSKETGKIDQQLKEITIVLDWTPNTNHTGLYVAQKLGYFKDAGLKVNIIQPPEDGAAVLVASGQAEFGIDFQDYMAPALIGENALPITAVAALIQHNTSGILSLKEKGITSPKGMENLNYATWDLPVEKAMIEFLVNKDGGDYNKVKLVPNATDVVTALKTDVDSIWVYYAWDGIATKIQGLETNYFAFKDFGEEFDYYNPVIISNNDYLKKNPEQAKKFLKAVEDGYKYAIDQPEQAADILCQEVPELDKTLVKESQKWLADQYQAEAKHWGEFDAKRWDGFYHWLFTEKLIEEEIKPGAGFTNDYLSLD